MEIEKEKSAFLDIYKYYPSAIKFTFDVENECFVLSKKNPLDHEVATISQMNQQWYAWLACAKSKAQAVPEGFEIGRLQDRITELLDERQELYAQLDRTEEDSKRINFLADKNQWIANVQLPREIVERNLSSLRNAIDRAMDLAAQEPTND